MYKLHSSEQPTGLLRACVRTSPPVAMIDSISDEVFRLSTETEDWWCRFHIILPLTMDGYWLFNVTCNDIWVIYVTVLRCPGLVGCWMFWGLTSISQSFSHISTWKQEIFQVARPGIKPRLSCSANHSATTTPRCPGGLKKKLYLRSGSQRHRHFVGFFNVPVQAPTWATLFIRLFRETAPFSRLLRHAGDTEDVFST